MSRAAVRRCLLAAGMGLWVVLAGCGSPPAGGGPAAAAAAPPLVFTGSAGYRERILPPPGARGIVSLLDVSRMDAAATELARHEVELGASGVPFHYRLEVPRARMMDHHRYAVRAVVRDAQDQLLWTSDTQHPVSAANPQLAPIMMVRVQARGAPADAPPSALQGSNWRVEVVAGAGVIDNSRTSLHFGSDGVLSGRAGCNDYTARYQLDGDRLHLDTMAVTSRACVPALADQEARFLAVMRDVQRWRLRQDGGLELVTADGRRVLAQR